MSTQPIPFQNRTNIQLYPKRINRPGQSNFFAMLGYTLIRQIIRITEPYAQDVYNQLRNIIKSLVKDRHFYNKFEQINVAYAFIKNVMNQQIKPAIRINWLDEYLKSSNYLDYFEILFESIIIYLLANEQFNQNGINWNLVTEQDIISWLHKLVSYLKIHIFLFTRDNRRIITSNQRQNWLTIYLEMLENNQFQELMHQEMQLFDTRSRNLPKGDAEPFCQYIVQPSEIQSLNSSFKIEFDDCNGNSVYWHLKCPICLDLCEQAVQTECCQSIGCEKCFKQVLKCPICRSQKFTIKNCQPIREIIGEFPYTCPDCQIQITKKQQQAHLQQCPEQMYYCKLCPFKGKQHAFISHILLQHQDDLLEKFTNDNSEDIVNNRYQGRLRSSSPNQPQPRGQLILN